jgi:hypothetical protein
MSQAGRDECQTFPVATLNNNDRRSKVESKITPNLIPWTMRRRSDHDPCPAASIKAPIPSPGPAPHHMPLREITLATDAYLAEHRAELLAEAKGNR